MLPSGAGLVHLTISEKNHTRSMDIDEKITLLFNYSMSLLNSFTILAKLVWDSLPEGIPRISNGASLKRLLRDYNLNRS